MQSLLEEKARDVARLQRQVEDLQHSLAAIIPGVKAPSRGGPPLKEARPSQAHGPPPGEPSREQPQGSASAKNLPKRITVTLNDHVHQRLIDRSLAEGRSVSNLAAYILEAHLEQPPFQH
jgi:hypothetical protein